MEMSLMSVSDLGVDLVDRDEDGLLHAAQQVGDLLVERSQAFAPVHQEDQGVRFRNGAAGLLADQTEHLLVGGRDQPAGVHQLEPPGWSRPPTRDRKSTRLNSSHLVISYAVFCLKKKKKKTQR